MTRRDVCLACDQCIIRPVMPLACALIVNPDRDFQPCAAKLARMQAYPHAQCPYPDPAQHAKWSTAALNILGRPVNANPPAQARQTSLTPASQRMFRGASTAATTPIYARRRQRTFMPMMPKKLSNVADAMQMPQISVRQHGGYSSARPSQSLSRPSPHTSITPG